MYAVSRNIEEPAKEKMTPMVPTAIDSNDEVTLKGATIVRPESDQVQSTPAGPMKMHSTQNRIISLCCFFFILSNR